MPFAMPRGARQKMGGGVENY